MKILGLDMSSHTGFAVLDADTNKLLEYGLIELTDEEKYSFTDSQQVQDYEMIYAAKSIADKIMNVVRKHTPWAIVIEQTNKGKNRTSQKYLEFIHFAVLCAMEQNDVSKRVFYMDTSYWRKALNIRLNPEQKINNKAVKAKTKRGKITTKHLSVNWCNENYGLQLKLKANNEADALCMCAAFARKQISNSKHIDIDLQKALQS